ncbi:unnamed protein product [Adineta steineri]|uniref:Uncharacterized protein n=1 Tax=Adineta steineri TaxID=433720 RepID=A0A814XME1_9BILA|nr:unnamed protein product [Adineta steineri]CAF3690973.1 unnamed protein product [Adineta steineri]
MLSEYTEKQIEGVRKIQRLWRRYVDIQVFRFYRDLIHFHNNGDPQILMRTINPNESKYIDSAAGIRIRFRLAGERFPPTIYYKIYTNRPIQDLGAVAPRDYTRPYLKLPSPVDINNRLNRFPQQDKEGWYRRIENNGWRPVAYTHLLQANTDQYYSSNQYKKSIPFPHSKMQRRQDVERRRKEKKLEWLQKMYQTGTLSGENNEEITDDGHDNEMSRLINETTTSILKMYNTYGADAVQEWEVNDLLDWTHNLNYDDYLYDWRTIGTSASSNFLQDNPTRQRQMRDIDDRTTSTLTESRHVSVQVNVPTVESLRVLPNVDSEPSFGHTTITARSQSGSEHKKLV